MVSQLLLSDVHLFVPCKTIVIICIYIYVRYTYVNFMMYEEKNKQTKKKEEQTDCTPTN